ncbi:amino acid adenylation domain-containing protein [Micromonospora profundi]|uniref:amino acid adenylation domain-containing protein n=1 Tax=Micromonospora profundi TaxID=1420889 RepID=UPI0033A40236
MTAEHRRRFTLVVSDAGATSIWPTTLTTPAGWQSTGFVGDRSECLAEALRNGEPAIDRRAESGETLLSLVAGAATRFPDRTAVSDDTTALTYRELLDRASAVSRALIGHGVRRGDRVVVYLRRSASTVVALLGVLAAGAAYVAVDPRYPAGRRDMMIDGSRPSAILAEPEWVAGLTPTAATVVGWDEDLTAADAVPVTVSANDVAAVLFTSGSTGRPKAIELEHRNLVYFASNAGLPPIDPVDRVGQVSSVSFDAYHFEIWRTLASGATVVVLPELAGAIGTDLQRELRRRRITVMLAPTMAVNHVVYDDQEAFAPLRLLHTGGDVLQRAACAKLIESTFAGEFLNLYGPAEASTACTAYRVNDLAPDATAVPIGRPLQGAAVYLLGPDLAPVPAGAVGEIHIGGQGVARGYLGAPDATASRFLPDPYGVPGSRMYATGDLGRHSQDGLLMFTGRADNQVKIRGYRVDPGEVEQVLSTHPVVREAAVVVAGSGQDLWLIALVVADRPLPPQELRAFAADLLPDYLIPSAFVQVAEIPATEHGKRDMERLRHLAADQDRRRREYDPPTDDTERYLARVWEQMLGVEWIGRADDFFALGGNSLLAFRLQRRIKRDLGAVVEVRALLATTSLHRLAELVRQTPKEAEGR